MKCTLFE